MEFGNELIEYYNELTGEQLPASLVEEGKRKELQWIRSIGLYTKVPRQPAEERSAQVITVKRVIVNTGDHVNPNVRCMLVAKQIKAKTREALLAHELFSAMPPWEMMKALLSILVSSDVPDCDEELELPIIDISRAHFMVKVVREIYVEVVCR